MSVYCNKILPSELATGETLIKKEKSTPSHYEQQLFIEIGVLWLSFFHWKLFHFLKKKRTLTVLKNESGFMI